jgi:hypothetical protein
VIGFDRLSISKKVYLFEKKLLFDEKSINKKKMGARGKKEEKTGGLRDLRRFKPIRWGI